MTDTGGPGRPIVYLNGSYADQSHWQRVIAELGGDYRHITYDERARGKSKRSADYSFEACVPDALRWGDMVRALDPILIQSAAVPLVAIPAKEPILAAQEELRRGRELRGERRRESRE